jgi:hypothetical protein
MNHLLSFSLLSFLLFGCTLNESEKSQEIIKKANDNWIGEWERDLWQNDATLKIISIENDSLYFSLFASSGGHLGELEGKAFINKNIAIYSDYNDEYDTCIVEFKLIGDSIINIVQKQGLCFTGMGVTYTGQYINKKILLTKTIKEKTFIDLHILTTQEDSIFRELVGDKYSLFVNTTQLTSEDTDLDSLHAKVIASGVRGLFTSMENIIMIDSSNNIWAAVIDNSDNKVLYYTNRKDYSHKLPNTINNWRENFKEYEIIYESE